jgi:uncharacterized protein with PIN domain
MIRYIQKKILLPLIWGVKREKIIRDMRIRGSEEIYKKIEEIRSQLIVAQRNNDEILISRLKGILDNLLWVTYDSSKL